METITTVGRRKAAIARVRLNKGKGKVTVNGKDYKEYFPVIHLQATVVDAVTFLEKDGKYDINVNVKGGGFKGQAEAVRLGIARAFVVEDEESKIILKSKDKLIMRRDARVVERKKFGYRKARKKEQYSKR